MLVTVRLFAGAREAAGASQLILELEGPTRVADARRLIALRHPELRRWVEVSQFAVNFAYADEDQEIDPASELALIPPVSGGSPPPPETWIEVIDGPIDAPAVAQFVRSDQAGAVCSFLGTVREMTGERRTTALEYEAYPGMARKKLVEIARDSCKRWGLIRLAILHRVGRLGLGEISVAISVSSAHRKEAFEACNWLIDELKRSVPIWKKEQWADGTEEWVGPAGP